MPNSIVFPSCENYLIELFYRFLFIRLLVGWNCAKHLPGETIAFIHACVKVLLSPKSCLLFHAQRIWRNYPDYVTVRSACRRGCVSPWRQATPTTPPRADTFMRDLLTAFLQAAAFHRVTFERSSPEGREHPFAPYTELRRQVLVKMFVYEKKMN